MSTAIGTTVDSRDQPPAAPDSRRKALESCLHEAAALPGIDAGTCGWLEEKLSEEVFNLVAAGQFKRGKSTVVNALLGEPLLPAGVVPLTSVVTVIRSGRKLAVRVELRNGQKLEIDPNVLGDYVTERGNPGNTKGVHRVVIEHPSPWLANGVRLVDTPGIGSVYEHNTDETRRYLPQADAVLFVASVDQPIARAELDFLRDIRDCAGKVFCLLNKTDHLRPEELRESLAFSTEAVAEALGASVAVFPVSARLALEGKQSGDARSVERSGFTALEEALRRFMEREKTAAWLSSIARGLERLLAQTRFTLDLEATLLTRPLDDIETNLAAFRAEKVKAERARSDYQVLLAADARTLLREQIEPKLERFERDLQARMGAELDGAFRDLESMSSRKLQAVLEQRMIASIRAAYDEWLAREDVELARAFQGLCARFWASLQESVDELMHRSSELFDIAFDRTKAESRWTTESGFYYKFWYEPTSLRILSSSAVLALPRWLAGRLILKRAKATAGDLIEAQAGRIRHDLEERLKKSVQDAQREMLKQIEATVAGVEAAIDSALATRQRSAAHVTARSEELARLGARIASLRARIARAAGGGLAA